MAANQISVLFVCLGNICRSPAAEGTFSYIVKERNLQSHFQIDSCGTAGYHIGEPPNTTSRKIARKHGIDLHSRSRKLQADDFHEFQYIMAMDRSNYEDIQEHSNSTGHISVADQVMMFRQFDPAAGFRTPDQILPENQAPDVPDPYYGGLDGFESVQKIMLRTSHGLLDWIIYKHNISNTISN